MASEAQYNYIVGLALKKDLTNLHEQFKPYIMEANHDAILTLNNQEVNQVLDALKQLPWLPRLGVSVPPVPAVENEGPRKLGAVEIDELKQLEDKVDKGRYFIVDPTDNTEKFIHITKPGAPSKWQGYTFVNVQASDYLHPVRNPAHRVAILETIAQDPINAMNEYGQRLGVCGMCGRTLTDRDSRLRGIGPICAAKIMGQATEEQINILDKLFPDRHNK